MSALELTHLMLLKKNILNFDPVFPLEQYFAVWSQNSF